MARKRRKHSKIDKLSPELKATVEDMMKADFTYAEIADYIKDQTDQPISISSVCRYAANLNESVETLRMAQENFRVIMEEINKYPALDTSEGIIRLLSHNVLESIQNTPEEKWKNIDPEALLKQATSLVKAAAYKKNMDLKNEDILNAGFEQVKSMVFEAMARERPDLYKDVAKFLEEKRRDI